MLSRIKMYYPHRIEADPTVCPVCVGDGMTDDHRFGTAVHHTINDGSPTPRPIYICLACEVWEDARVTQTERRAVNVGGRRATDTEDAQAYFAYCQAKRSGVV